MNLITGNVALYVFLGVDRSIIDGGGGCINFSFLIKLYICMYVIEVD